jgi:hypothetical protein
LDSIPKNGFKKYRAGQGIPNNTRIVKNGFKKSKRPVGIPNNKMKNFKLISIENNKFIKMECFPSTSVDETEEQMKDLGMNNWKRFENVVLFWRDYDPDEEDSDEEDSDEEDSDEE